MTAFDPKQTFEAASPRTRDDLSEVAEDHEDKAKLKYGKMILAFARRN
jgi:hypothetical protein